MTERIPFTGNPLDRAGNLRHDEAWVAEQMASPHAKFLPVWKLHVLTHESEHAALQWLDGSVLQHGAEGQMPFLLGVRDGVPYFAIDISHIAEPLPLLGVEGVRFAEVRDAGGRLDPDEAGLIAQARSLIDWHARHRFCPACGGATEPAEGGSQRRCTACKAQHFPRTDPVVIMAVWRDDSILLGRRRNATAPVYSTLAGFIDQGETIEEAVRREVLEESGIEVDEVRYLTSQPWPFPSSLMIGCHAHATSFESKVDDIELEDVRWFDRDSVRRAVYEPSPDLGFSVPGRIAIAHHLIKAWVDREPGDRL
jgi:NAD+ diphosphatase